MWKSLFLHEFLDKNPRIFKARPGHVTSTLRSPIHGEVFLNPGEGLTHEFLTPVNDVIGLSGRLSLHIPGFANPPGPLRLGNGVSFSVATHDESGALVPTGVLVTLKIGNQSLQATAPVSHAGFQEFRFDWHTSGQARITNDGTLIGYHNAIATGATLQVPSIAFGMGADMAAEPCSARKVFVRALRRPDALATLISLLPAIQLPTDPEQRKCLGGIGVEAIRKLDRLRPLMAKFHQTTSQPWTAATGPGAGPFQPAATLAHARALNSGRELVRLLHKRVYAKSTNLLLLLARFLRDIRTVLPAEFKSLAKEILRPPLPPGPACEQTRKAVEQSVAPYGPLLRRLFEELHRVVTRVAEGQ
jgi:hypothetical protein